MNDEIEDQLDKLFSDFKIKVSKLIVKNNNKMLKEQARSFKEERKVSSSPRRGTAKSGERGVKEEENKGGKGRGRRPRDYDSEEDSD